MLHKNVKMDFRNLRQLRNLLNYYFYLLLTQSYSLLQSLQHLSNCNLSLTTSYLGSKDKALNIKS